MGKKKKVRVDLRKNRAKPPRKHDLTRDFQEHGFADKSTAGGERVRAKGDLSRRRTIIQDAGPDDIKSRMPAVDPSVSGRGRVLRVHGLWSVVEREDGALFRCSVRRLLKQILTDERNIITTGDIVWFRPAERHRRATAGDEMPEGLIERVEPRRGVLTRASRGREHVLVANVDQLAIVVSLVEPELKPHLIDRYIASAVRGDLRPIICLNKADLIGAELLQPLIGAYNQIGIPILLTSAITGQGLGQVARLLAGRATVFSGQSGVGKSSLLNALQPGLDLRVREVSDVNQKGKHTTTTAELIRLDHGGWVVDTPGLRQLQLWDIQSADVEGYFSEFRPFVSLCEFPDCTHTHEGGCALKRAVFRNQVSDRRYHSYRGCLGGNT
jgi:ribosome biogenesis GTPase